MRVRVVYGSGWYCVTIYVQVSAVCWAGLPHIVHIPLASPCAGSGHDPVLCLPPPVSPDVHCIHLSPTHDCTIPGVIFCLLLYMNFACSYV